MAGGFDAVTFGKVFTLEGHTVLDGNAAAQGFDAVDVGLGDSFRMVEEPVQSVERDIAVHLLEHVQHAADGFVISGVQAERPAVLHQMAHHALQLVLHARREVRARFEEIFKIGGGEDQHLARAVVAEEVTALARREHVGPFFKVFQFVAWALGKEVIGDADGHLLFIVQLGNHLVIFRIVLEATTRVDGAGQPQTVQLAHELTGGVDLLIQRQLRPFGQCGVEDHGVRTGNQHPGRVAPGIALDLTTRRIWRVFGVADHLQRGAVEQGAVVQVQNEDRGVRRRVVNFVQGRHATLGELELGPAAHHAHPLGRRRAQSLLFQHPQGIGQRWHTFPAQLEVVVQPTANQVEVGVVQAGNGGVAF
ncbi:hypothetical protein PSEG_05547 [Pseudomonas sp. Nvir]